MGKQHVIELNGKQYDALTGKVIDRKPVASPATAQAKPAAKPRGRVIDGFTKSPQASTQSRQPNAAAAHQAQKSKTLMRKTVAKPAVKPTVASTSQKTPAPVMHSSSSTDQKRLEAARKVPKSPTISRFSPLSSSKSVVASTTKMLPSKKQTTKPAQPTSVAVPAQTASQAMIEKALANATPTTTPRHKREKSTTRLARRFHISPRQISVTGFVVAALVIVGFFTYQNSSQISMKLAASRAGIHASLPHYQPAGFAIAGGVAYNPGQVTVSYKSTTDNRNYRLSQNVSEWNSQALLDNYVAVNHPNNQTVQDHGKTVYLYDGSNATWVDSGIWYRIEGDSQLSSDQLLNIAASL